MSTRPSFVRSLLIGGLLGVMTIVLVWLLAKVARTDESLWRLVRIGVALAGCAAVVGLGILLSKRKRGHD